MTYPLENLGPERFQHLCQALLVSEYPGVVCYPVGQPDGGRDAVQRGFEDSPARFTVYQVKYSRNPVGAQEVRAWVIEAASGEVEKVKRLIARGATHYVFITNVLGTSHLDVGSMDKLQEELESKLGIPVSCWWRDDIDRRLDSNWNVKLRYPEVLSGQDFLRLILESSNKDSYDRRQNAIRAFLASQFAEDQEVKFKQVELQNRLLDLFVDLPFKVRVIDSIENARRLAQSLRDVSINHATVGGQDVIEINDHPSGGGDGGTAALILSDAGGFLSQLVVEGAPGQGKSTLAQYLCQVHRIRLLNKSDDLSLLPELHRLSPVCIPFKVDLRDLSEWIVGGDPFVTGEQKATIQSERSVETFLARLVQHGAGGVEFTVNDIVELSKMMPIFVAFDGLDEVADIRRRSEVVTAVTRSLLRLRENCPGLRAVITSRPAAFANSPGFDAKVFPHLQLGAVKRDQIKKYAKKWMDARNLSHAERREFEQVLEEKLGQPHLRDLSRNPMQLTILLSLIHTKGAALPDKRTALYDAYVDLFFSRESTKNAVVRKHLDLLKDIHRYLAWVLHSSAELGKGASSDGRLTSEQLREVLSKYLISEHQSTEIIDEVFNAMLERVVMIVSRIEGTHEFEVQPLREYFAARYLYDTASYSPAGRERSGTKPDRFDAIARNRYWLNVVRFFCGCFSKGELLDLADRVSHLVKEKSDLQTKHPVILSAMLLADWVFAQSPKAVIEIAGALSSRGALRRLIPGEFYYRTEETLRIPDSCGGVQVRRSAYKYLFDASTKPDLSRKLASFIVENGPLEERLAEWKAAIPKSDDRLDNWLQTGRSLRLLKELTHAELDTLFKERTLNSESIQLLFGEGHDDWMARTPRLAAGLRHQFETNFLFRDLNQNAPRPFYLVPQLLSYVLLGSRRVWDEARQKFLQAATSFECELEEAQTADLPLEIRGYSAKCYQVSRSVATSLKANHQLLDSISFWDATVDQIAAECGTTLSIVMVAICLASYPRDKVGRIAKQSLLSPGAPLMSRLRYAKSRAKRWDWWQDQFASAEDKDNRLLAYMAFYAFAPTALVIENASELERALDTWVESEWDTALSALEMIFSFLYLQKTASKRAAVKSYEGRSSRFAILLALKEPSAYARNVFLSFFASSAHTGKVQDHFRVGQAISAASDNQFAWEKALEIIRSAYGRTSIFLSPIRKVLPKSVVEEVLRNPDAYPSALLDPAYAQAAASESKKNKPVAQIAKTEKWFIQ